MALNNREQLENIHIIIIRLQQEIILSGETHSPTILIFQYIKVLTNSVKLKALISPKIIYLIKFLHNIGKSDVYKRENIFMKYIVI